MRLTRTASPLIVALDLMAGIVTLAARPAMPAHRTMPAAYPTPVEETYQGCPPQGDGGDAQLNRL